MDGVIATRCQVGLEIELLGLVACNEGNILCSLSATKPNSSISRPSHKCRVGGQFHALTILIYLLQDGRTALHLASAAGHIETVTALTLNGADVSAQDFVSEVASDPKNHFFHFVFQTLLACVAAIFVFFSSELFSLFVRQVARLGHSDVTFLASQPRR